VQLRKKYNTLKFDFLKTVWNGHRSV